MQSKFLLGRIQVTTAAKRALGRHPLDLIARHAVGDYGRVGVRERDLNDHNRERGGEILSRYYIDPTRPELGCVEVVTLSGWGRTIVRLNGERLDDTVVASKRTEAP